ncbi:MAG: polysaccharide deacetylase family protein [Halothiobacillaceae bacterium]
MTAEPAGRALLSIHDVMPETLDRVEAVLGLCRDRGIPPLTLLVVPGRAWHADEIERLRAWARAGHELAAHGWFHEIERFGGLWHRLHGLLLSRRVAEHLSLSPEDVLALMQRAHGWFAEHDLPPPQLYVPPAWALGRLPGDAAQRLPFRRIEVLSGIIEVPDWRLTRMPLAGFEADTSLRAAGLSLFNRQQWRLARRRDLPLRIGIHPNDLQLRLADSLQQMLAAPFRYEAY